jgi:hypothetical protein
MEIGRRAERRFFRTLTGLPINKRTNLLRVSSRGWGPINKAMIWVLSE